ncbi:cupin domain-containing protein [Leptolyngbya sp. NIES-2104]|uniref:cupin domain-containing protein n=1 Tax=Leptolyngbya sp. NIES-2104 TaxID=1552121 RepID=UPI0006EC80F0|nr:cupin domain-containing protein [Leptolyngbya sp. NIES-2104]GAP99983.1 mannose-6-phosphate isomerase [Leptolyngbya sp. NIES-2104]
MNIVDVTNAEQYPWGEGCRGWHLLKRDDFSIIEECVPPGQSEQRHFHEHSRQFFYILQGEAVLEIEGHCYRLRSHQGIEIPPNVAHQFRNESESEVRFLVISVPKAQGDRISRQ